MAAVTKEQVFETADQLESEGSAVNQRSIIAKIGGSHSTVGKFLNEWKEQKEFSQSLKSVEIPLALSEKLNLFGAEIWRDASKIAEVENVALREQVIRLQAQIAEQRDEHVKDISEIEAKHSKSLEEIEHAHTAEIEKLQARLKDISEKYDLRVSKHTQATIDLQEAQKEIAKLQGEAANMSKLEEMFAKFMKSKGDK